MHGAWGRTLGWVTADGSTWYQQFVPFPGRKALGFYYGGLWAPFDHPNALGSTQMATMANGGAMADYELYPWGDVWQEGGTTNYDENFGGMLRQFNQYYLTRFRRYLVPEGRWLTPDPLGGDIWNPQSLNRYAYVMNNPTTLTDPLGLDATNCTPNGNGGLSCSGADSVNVTATPLNACGDPEGFTEYAMYGAGGPCPSFIPGPSTLIPPTGFTGSGGGGGTGGTSWWGAAARSFLTFAGGPGNQPTCAGQALSKMGEDLNPFKPGVEDAAPAARSLAVSRGVAKTEAAVDAYIQERGLIVPLSGPGLFRR